MNHISPPPRSLRLYESIWLRLKVREKCIIRCKPEKVKTIKRMVEKEKYEDNSFRLLVLGDQKAFLRSEYNSQKQELTFYLHLCNGLPWTSEVMEGLTQMNSAGFAIPLSNAEQIKERISHLQEALQKQIPNYESILHTIHRNLLQDPDTVHLLSEEEIGIIVAGLCKKTNVVIQEAEKKKASKGKITLADLE